MKTDLARILTVSGQKGLYLYVAQARNGVIAESLQDKKRTVFDAKSRITTLADIAIYTHTMSLSFRRYFLLCRKYLAKSTLLARSLPTLI